MATRFESLNQNRYEILEPLNQRKGTWFLLGLISGGIGAAGALILFSNHSSYHIHFEEKLMGPSEREGELPHIVIIGSGWGGLACAKEIDTKLYNVTLISPRDYFLFTPLLPEISLGKIESGR